MSEQTQEEQADTAESDAIRTLLDGYPDAAMMVGADAGVIATNAKGASLQTLLEHGKVEAIQAMIANAASEHKVVVGPILLEGAKGEILLEVSVIPQIASQGPAAANLLVLSHDVTLERNLRSALVESRQRYKDLVEVSSDFAWEIGSDRTFGFVSPPGALGFTPEDLLGKNPADYVIDAEQYNPLPFLSDRAMDSVEIWMQTSSGENACVVASCLPLTDDSGRWCGVRGICRDVTEDRKREAALRNAQERERLLGYIVNAIRDELDPLNMLEKASKATSQAMGGAGCRVYRRLDEDDYVIAADFGNVGELEGIADLLVRLDEESEAFTINLGNWNVLAASTHYNKQINGAICIWKESKEEWDEGFHILIGDVANQIGIANEQIANHERIVNLSRTDAMTGLLNRRAFFEEELPRRFSRLERDNLTAALLYLDLDNFKLVNDVHGHQAGDEALIFLRDMLLEFSRPGDAIVRLGGDEFALWLDGVAPDVTLRRVETILKASEELMKYSGDDDHPLGLSIGVALYDPKDMESIEDMVSRADAAMYEVKRDGKGGYRVAPPPSTEGEGGGDG
ncbi:MAG: diguanylate cyclase [Rhodospirillaceae bacterium]|jgi:diguanylate cyclase (GGDEF)-like protein/PAS domain S-box-containing protein|nr:diguanylate cyclase [Rhodospirillaceae bacterium]MBT4219656.1 diguanylate cyclase [Rhodospirillaceae bacterium]MBT5013584.1 diguanylate cyclase [Rhodospirillaceae bacterium]MBT5308904.1 diguanylate cyclase [Rhodospirillaceae bacterium]MBT6407756.1 diguanylate cyclase [Rhodospirillaceae bacterium]